MCYHIINMEELMKMSKKIILKTGLNKRAFFVARALGCNFLEVYYGDYKFNKVEDCKFAAILGNADFSGCENLDISKLKFIKGNLVVNDTANVSINVEYVGKNVFGINRSRRRSSSRPHPFRRAKQRRRE